MVKVKEDLSGKTFGKWKVLSQTDDYVDKQNKHYARWLCECQCDKHTIRKVIGKDLKQKKRVLLVVVDKLMPLYAQEKLIKNITHMIYLVTMELDIHLKVKNFILT